MEKTNLNIVFLWDWEPELGQTLSWKDGLAAALRELEKRGHAVHVVVPMKHPTHISHEFFHIIGTDDVSEVVKELNPDVILHWGDMTRPNAPPLTMLGIPMAICFAGGEALGENYPLFDHVFVESQTYFDVFEEKGVSVSRAFGTNTDLYTPVRVPKLYDTLFPATFALWKRHELYAKATSGLRSLAVGYMYESHETECWQVCLDNRVAVMPHVSASTLRYMYAASEVVVITSESAGGSQRTVLEAMAMNIPVIVTDSDKFDFAEGRVWKAEPRAEDIRGLINVLLDGEQNVNTRDYILNNYSHIQYADALEEGLRRIA